MMLRKGQRKTTYNSIRREFDGCARGAARLRNVFRGRRR